MKKDKNMMYVKVYEFGYLDGYMDGCNDTLKSIAKFVKRESEIK